MAKKLGFDIHGNKLTLKGEVTAASLETGFAIFKDSIILHKEAVLIVDWEKVTKLDSSCLALMLWVQSLQVEKIKIINLSKRLQILSELYGLSSVFQAELKSEI